MLRTSVAKVAYFVIFSVCGVLGMIFSIHILLYFMGGMELIERIWLGGEPVYLDEYHLLMLVGVVLGGAGGGWFGFRFSPFLLRKTRLLSEAEIERLL